MANRSACDYLVMAVERLIGDEANEYHSSDNIQEALDQNRIEARYLKLIAHEVRASGGASTYKVFTAPQGLTYWEDDASILDYNFDAAAPTTSDWKVGRWEYDTTPTRPLYILGFSYDIFGTAASLVEDRMAQVAEKFTFAAEGDSYQRDSRYLNLMSRYKGLIKKKRIVPVDIIRTDTQPL